LTPGPLIIDLATLADRSFRLSPMRVEAVRLFDLARGPLLRITGSGMCC
jgi:hypothetical protein